MTKRFYRQVGVAPAAGGFTVLLDGKSLRSPGRRVLVLPGARLARAIAAEWDGQAETVDPAAMPLTRLANTALDTTTGRREAVVGEIAGYARTDVVCYRVARPHALRRRQAEAWDPLIAWLGKAHGARLVVTASLSPAIQPASALAAVRCAVEAFDDFGLTALCAAAGVLGSVTIALAMAAGRIGATEALRTSLIEECYQNERWGEDDDVRTRRARLSDELAAADRFLRLCR